MVTIVEGPNGQPFTCDDTSIANWCKWGLSPITSPNFVVAMDWDDVGEGNVVFVATSTFPNTNFVWYFGDGQQAEKVPSWSIPTLKPAVMPRVFQAGISTSW